MIPLPIDQLVAEYESGSTSVQIAERHQTSPQTVIRRLRAQGVPIRKRESWKAGPVEIPLDESRLRELAGLGMSTQEIGSELGVSEECARRRMVKLGVARLPGKARPERNYFWGGGRNYDGDGYVLIHSPDHPHATKAGYVREHRLVAERNLGRYLLPTEVVHHIDGIHDHNDWSNLEVFASNGEHLRSELTGRVPNWSPEGWERIQAGVQRAADLRASTREASRTDERP